MIDFLGIKENWDLVLSFGVILIFGSLIVFSVWFHRTIRKTAGGRALMDRQKRNPAVIVPGGLFFGAASQLKVAGSMFKDVRNGKYGSDVKRLMTRTYWFIGVWIVIAALWFGILVYIDSSSGAGG